MPHPRATVLLPGATTPRLEAMTRQEATGRQAHMIHQERTQQQETTPRPHRMSRQPHTGNPCPSAMITLTTRQSPLTDRRTPHPQTVSPHCRSVCVRVCLYVYLHKGQYRWVMIEGIRFECASKQKRLSFSPS